MKTSPHPTADVQSTAIGPGTRIWQFCVVLPGARIGADCNVCAHCLIENDVIVGDRVTIKSGVQLWDGIRLEDDVFVGPNVTFTNDPAPRSRQRPAAFLTTTVGRGASIGANATLLPGLKIGAGAMIGAGAVVTHDVPPHAIVKGNPARITGYTTTIGTPAPVPPGTPAGSVPGVTRHVFPIITDLRGDLLPVELDDRLPFSVRRLFFISGVPSERVRGEHAHRECHQLLLCLSGGVTVTVDDGTRHESHRLDTPGHALYIPPMIWAAQSAYTPDAVLAVLASHPYDATDYLRVYDDYRGARALGP